ncbi:MAG: hypothetical protein AB1798_23880, partial [Spirochaetota bacterium]
DSIAEGTKIGIVIVSGSCCIPGMAAFDKQASKIVEQAVAETGAPAQVGVMPATIALNGGVPKEVIAYLTSSFYQNGKIGLPLVLVDGRAVSYGVPDIDTLKTALIEAAKKKNFSREDTNE